MLKEGERQAQYDIAEELHKEKSTSDTYIQNTPTNKYE